jgi:proline dehydrogenase
MREANEFGEITRVETAYNHNYPFAKKGQRTKKEYKFCLLFPFPFRKKIKRIS